MVDIDAELAQRTSALWERLLDACRVGAPLTDLLAAYDAAGVPLPPMPMARGLGLGNDLPLVTPALPLTAGEQPRGGHGVGVTGYVWKEGVGAIYAQEPVVVTDSGPELLAPSHSANEETDDVSAADDPPAEEIILYEKDPETRIATITLNRPDQLNIPTIAARRRYADLLFKAQHRRRREGPGHPR